MKTALRGKGRLACDTGTVAGGSSSRSGSGIRASGSRPGAAPPCVPSCGRLRVTHRPSARVSCLECNKRVVPTLNNCEGQRWPGGESLLGSPQKAGVSDAFTVTVYPCCVRCIHCDGLFMLMHNPRRTPHHEGGSHAGVCCIIFSNPTRERVKTKTQHGRLSVC